MKVKSCLLVCRGVFRASQQHGDEVSEEFKSICQNLYNNASWSDKVKISFKSPRSLRMFHKGYYLAKGADKERLDFLFKVWHSMWSLTTSPVFSCKYYDNQEVWLEGHEWVDIQNVLQYIESKKK